MQPEDCLPTSKDARSSPRTASPDAAWWVDLTSLSERRKWSPQRRKQRAESLRLLRRVRLAGMLDSSSPRQIVDQDKIITVCSGIRGLSPAAAEKVIAHEFGHLVDDIAGRVPSAGLNAELRRVYNTLNTGQERTRHLTGPQHMGYRGDDVPKELMAEAIRAYMANPSYLKTVARRRPPPSGRP